MTNKLSGMEMMISSVLKMAGFDPKELTQATVTVVQQMQGGLSSVVLKLESLEREAQIAKLERRAIMDHLGIKAMGEILPPETSLTVPNGKDTHA